MANTGKFEQTAVGWATAHVVLACGIVGLVGFVLGALLF